MPPQCAQLPLSARTSSSSCSITSASEPLPLSRVAAVTTRSPTWLSDSRATGVARPAAASRSDAGLLALIGAMNARSAGRDRPSGTPPAEEACWLLASMPPAFALSHATPGRATKQQLLATLADGSVGKRIMSQSGPFENQIKRTHAPTQAASRHASSSVLSAASVLAATSRNSRAAARRSASACTPSSARMAAVTPPATA